MSRGVKVHDAITEWDGYALFDKDNVLASALLCDSIMEADSVRRSEYHRDSDSISIWNVTLTKKGKVNDNSTEPI